MTIEKRETKTVTIYKDSYEYLERIKTGTFADTVHMVCREFALIPEPYEPKPIQKPEPIEVPIDLDRVVDIKRISPVIVYAQPEISPLDKFKRISLGSMESQI